MSTTPDTRTPVKAAVAAFVGTAVEWYDFYIYGTSAALIFNKLFFSSMSPLAGTLAAFATFAAGFLARPLGGIVFGHFGDRIGRRSTLVATLIMMGAATFLVGLLPTYGSFGVAAPVCLTLLRVLQGFAAGGETGGGMLMALEHASDKHRGVLSALPLSGGAAGLLLSTGLFSICRSAFGESFTSFGWRIPFLFSGVLVAIGLFIRLSVHETPEFETAKAADKSTKKPAPFIEVIRSHPKAIAIMTGASVLIPGGSYLQNTFMLTYANEKVHISENVMLTAVMVVAVCGVAGDITFGALGDRIGHRKVAISGCAFGILMAFPMFILVNTGNTGLIWTGLILNFLGQAALFGNLGVLLGDSFPTEVRYSGVSIAYQLSALLSGALTPLIATALLGWADSYWADAVFMMLLAAISLVSVSFIPATLKEKNRTTQQEYPPQCETESGHLKNTGRSEAGA